MIIVTGGSGFIGSNLIKALNRRDRRDIIVVDPLWEVRTKDYDVLGYLKPEEFIDVMEDLFIECFFHLGAETDTTELDAYNVLIHNYIFSKRIAEFCIKNGIRFIYASSAATYGQGSFNDNQLLKKLQPLNLYGYSKHVFDLQMENKPVVGLKYFNVFGPGEDHKGKMRSMIAQMKEEISETGYVTLFKDGEQRRDHIYINDVVDMTLHFFDHPHLNGLYNIGTGFNYTFNEIADLVFKIFGLPTKINYVEMPESLKSKYQNNTKADITKLRSSGYTKSVTPISDAIKDYIDRRPKDVSTIRDTVGCPG